MRFTRKMLLCFVASSTILISTLASSAITHPVKRRPATRHKVTSRRPAARHNVTSRRSAAGHKVASRRAVRSAQLDLQKLQLQVLLDRAGFSPGEIDGAGGANTDKALEAFRSSHQLPGDGDDQALRKALGADGFQTTVSYTITDEDTAGPFADRIPQDMTEKAKLPSLYYTSVLEELGEKFHSSPALLKRLNPKAQFTAGEQIQVPNVQMWQPPESSASKSEQNGKPGASAAGTPDASKVVVSKSKSELTVYDHENKIIFYAPVTSGSEHDPLPVGNWRVTGIRHHPVFYYNPNLFWDAEASDTKAKIAAGPNNPVGVVWIDINKPHYGLHGTPEPGRIGHSESHGCVRLTNWDADKLAGLVSVGTPVEFVE